MPESKPRVSVVIPTHNRSHLLIEAIESVFTQTMEEYEIIVVDDGSTDDTRQRLDTWINEGRIRYAYQEKAGVSAARNRGILMARAPFVALLDSDDIILPTKLEKELAVFAKEPDLGLVHSNFSKFTDEGKDLGIRDTTRYKGWLYPWILTEWSLLLSTSSLMFKREALLEAGLFDESMTWAEDIDLCRRVARLYRVGLVPEVLNLVRVHSYSSSAVKAGQAEAYRHALDKAFAEDQELSPLFRRRAYASMYTNLAENLVGEGSAELMDLVRQHCLKALGFWPIKFSALVVLLASFLPLSVRSWLVHRVRELRYPAFRPKRL
jgi:glycosyltransferase involved in cell wall biosynthesis